jgi:MscS family membrane protein
MDFLSSAQILEGLSIADQSWTRYAAAFGVLLLGLLIRKLFDLYVYRSVLRFTSKSNNPYDDALMRALMPPVSAFLFVLSLFIALNVLDLPQEPIAVRHYLLEAFRIAVAIIIIWLAFRLTDFLALFLSNYFSHSDQVIQKQFIPLVKKALRITVLVMGALLIIQNLGYSVGSLLAGLGIGGLAVALAAQDSLANFFGSIVLLTDRPFKVAEWVEVEGVSGHVEEIGFRSTRIRTFDKSLVTIPNKLLANSIVTNWTAMPKRRVKMTLGITYDTPADQVKAFVDGLREIIGKHPAVHKEVYLVHFESFNDFSLDIFVHYFTTSTQWTEYLAVREEINLEFMRLAEKMGVSFAFPSTSLYWGPKQKPFLEMRDEGR